MKVSWGHHTILQIRLPDRACNNATCRYNYPWQSWPCELAIKWINSSEPNDFLDVSDTKDKAMSIGLWRYICHSMSPVIQCDSIGLNQSPQGRGGVLFSILYHKWPCHQWRAMKSICRWCQMGTCYNAVALNVLLLTFIYTMHERNFSLAPLSYKTHLHDTYCNGILLVDIIMRLMMTFGWLYELMTDYSWSQ